MFDEPEFLVCLQCDTPTYDFDYVLDKLTAVVCGTCGNDDPKEFVTESEYEEES